MGDYIDLEDVQEFARTTYDNTTTPTDVQVNEYIDRAEAKINQRTGRTWGINSQTEIYDSPDYDLLLKQYPVLTITSVKNKEGDTLILGIDEDYIIDGDFIVFNPNKTRPTRATVEYTSGYDPVREDAAELNLLLVISKIRQSQSTTGTNSKKIKVGPIEIDKALGIQTVINLDNDIASLWRALRRLVQ